MLLLLHLKTTEFCKIQSLKYQRFTPSGCKDIGIFLEYIRSYQGYHRVFDPTRGTTRYSILPGVPQGIRSYQGYHRVFDPTRGTTGYSILPGVPQGIRSYQGYHRVFYPTKGTTGYSILPGVPQGIRSYQGYHRVFQNKLIQSNGLYKKNSQHKSFAVRVLSTFEN